MMGSDEKMRMDARLVLVEMPDRGGAIHVLREFGVETLMSAPRLQRRIIIAAWKSEIRRQYHA